ncbi:hypothetical protein N7E02_07935 (plasmid) [Aliirhizobium terrae]|uniref:hypothetical protein n=1 Tax=Terrirhizobium terrae TaxID=2926709 RepID=UPI002576B856|nr:hypothetical protein [Rhizobium sp. CC-CFT758]WJH38519.1 hypothetical protein N7E02_07935 [Rhizobium sp. CC-CFT758]
MSRKPASAPKKAPISGEVKAVELQPETEATIREFAQDGPAPPTETVKPRTADQTNDEPNIVDAAFDTRGEEPEDNSDVEARSVDRSDDLRPINDGEQVQLADDAEAVSSSGGVESAGSDREPTGEDVDEATVERIVATDKSSMVSANGVRSKRGNFARKVDVAHETASKAGQAVVAQPGAKKTVLDEMAELDAEIETLRGSLAQKLILQNAQLRALLRRYD